MTFSASVVALAEVDLAAPSAGQSLQYQANRGSVVRAGDALVTYQEGGRTRRVTAPVDVEILKMDVPAKARFPEGLPLLRVRVLQFALRGSVSGDALYRFSETVTSARGQIQSGPGPFNCPLVGGPTRGESGFTITCAPQDNSLRLVDGVDGVMAVDIGEHANVLVLPLSAVAGASERGTVSLKRNDKFVAAEVQLGLSDGVDVEVTSGLEEGDEVAAVPPGLTALPSSQPS